MVTGGRQDEPELYVIQFNVALVSGTLRMNPTVLHRPQAHVHKPKHAAAAGCQCHR